MHTKASCGFDSVSSWLLKLIKPVLTKSLTLITNQILTTGIFPDKLKTAKVIPIYKKGDETLFCNYRPISILLAISKIYDQLDSFLKRHKLMYNSQYGFRKEHSMEFVTVELIDRMLTRMDNKEIPINIYFNLSKAFDTLDHSILIDKLEFYGVKGVALDLLKNYLRNRKQYVEFEDAQSDMLNISTGVPQGSILGPLLFIIYKSSPTFNFIMYADDTTLSSTLDSFAQYSKNKNVEFLINTELEKIYEWLKLNKLSLNVNKKHVQEIQPF